MYNSKNKDPGPTSCSANPTMLAKQMNDVRGIRDQDIPWLSAIFAKLKELQMAKGPRDVVC